LQRYNFFSIFPVEYQKKAEDHPAKMGKMGDAVVGSCDAAKQFDGAVEDDEPLGFHGKEEVDVYQGIGEYHSEGEQQSIYRAGGANGNQTV